jgi:hypothetical protein
MKLDPIVHIKLDHHDLQKIYDRALDYVKNTSNRAIDSQLHPIYCILKAFTEYVNAQAECIKLEQPERLPMQPSDDE